MRTNTMINHCEPTPMRVLRSRLQYPSSKQHCVRPLLRRSSRRSQMRPWSTKLRTEAESRAEEGTAAELKSQVATGINKDEMIDVISCTRGSRPQGSCYPLELHQVAVVDTPWSQEGCVYWSVASSPRSEASAPCRSIRFPSPRPSWTKPERSATDWSSDAGTSRRRTDCRRHSSGARRRGVVTC